MAMFGAFPGRRGRARNGPAAADPARLHPVELGFLLAGRDVAITAACTGLYQRGVLVPRDQAESADVCPLAAPGGRIVDGHPVERAVVATVSDGVDVTSFWIRMRAADAMDELRRSLTDAGLLRRPPAFGPKALITRRRTAAGDRLVAAAAASAPPAGADQPEDAGARRVASLGVLEVRSVEPVLAEALGLGRPMLADSKPKSGDAWYLDPTAHLGAGGWV
ncbi:MAG TPA: hypothetical protein VFI47_18975 [Acidimicrobiales bacterium]|nr:hypothetical protein [Acidimicrobiales bacterium]